MSIAVLRQRIAEILEPQSAGVPHLPTGLSELDAVLQAQGIPRGRVTEITGALGGGKTTLLRQIVNTTAARGEWIAYVDATRTLAPRDWTEREGEGEGEGEAHAANLFVARPKAPTRAAWCTDILLRSGAFALVVLDGAPPLSRSVSMRLTRLARDSGAALVVVATDQSQPAMLGGALKLRVERSRRGKRLTITVERGGRGGTRRTIEVSYTIRMASRLRTHPEAPDRRGAARTKTGCGESGVGCGDTIQSVARVLPRKKRFADPPFPTPRRHTSGTRVSRPMRSA